MFDPALDARLPNGHHPCGRLRGIVADDAAEEGRFEGIEVRRHISKQCRFVHKDGMGWDALPGVKKTERDETGPVASVLQSLPLTPTLSREGRGSSASPI